ncbi:MAG: glycosyltransferase family 4 protein [Candidatus Aenigmarchaeota archaeon]|nr:glycosyltransferase family 4 protein [Candidatus Aenigmarchaeota archaeon]
MKILFVHPKGEIGGGDHSLLTIIKAMDKSRFRSYVIVPKKGHLFTEYETHAEKARQVDFTVLKTPDSFVELVRMLAGFVPSIFRIWKLIKKWDIDLVHVNSIVVPSAVIAAKLAGRKCVVHKREIIVSRKLVGNILDFVTNLFADKVIAVSNATRNYSKFIGGKTVVIYNGVDISSFSSRKGESSLTYLHKLHGKRKLVGVFSRIEPWKGQKIVVNALKQVVGEIRDIKVFIFGVPYTARGKAYFRGLKNSVSEYGLGDFIEFPGVVISLKKIYSEFDIILLPSIDPEPFSRVLIESMAAGVPVIATNIGGNVEGVIDGKTGILVKPNNPDDLADAMIKLLKDGELRGKMRKFSLEYVKKNFDIKDSILLVEKVYDEMVKK